MRRRFVSSLVLLAAFVAGGSAPLRTGAWFVDCDADLYCAAATIAAENDAKIGIRIGRQATGSWQVSFVPGSFDLDPAQTLALSIDGGPKVSFHPGEDFLAYGTDRPEFHLTDVTLAERILRGMEKGQRMDLMLAASDGSSHVFSASLKGFASALSHIEEAQKRPAGERQVAAPQGLPVHPSMAGATPLADGAIRFWAGDNGPGVAVDAQDKLFTHFTRLEKVGQSQGLGLAIVRRIVEKLGGEVGVERKEGQGSLFYFTLPAFRLAE